MIVVKSFVDYADKNALYYVLLYNLFSNLETQTIQEPPIYDLLRNDQLPAIPLETESLHVRNTTDINGVMTFINNTESVKQLVLGCKALEPLTSLVISDCNHIEYLQIGVAPFTSRVDASFYNRCQIQKCQIVDCPNLEYLFISNSVLNNCKSLELSNLPSLKYLHIDCSNFAAASSFCITSEVNNHIIPVDLPHLQAVTIGSHCFSATVSVVFQGTFPSLFQ